MNETEVIPDSDLILVDDCSVATLTNQDDKREVQVGLMLNEMTFRFSIEGARILSVALAEAADRAQAKNCDA